MNLKNTTHCGPNHAHIYSGQQLKSLEQLILWHTRLDTVNLQRTGDKDVKNILRSNHDPPPPDLVIQVWWITTRLESPSLFKHHYLDAIYPQVVWKVCQKKHLFFPAITIISIWVCETLLRLGSYKIKTECFRCKHCWLDWHETIRLGEALHAYWAWRRIGDAVGMFLL